jgi:hypothetical protein
MSTIRDHVDDIKKIDSIESAVNAAAPQDNPTFTGIVSGITASMVGAEPADATILKDADIGVNVQAYDANTTTQGNTFNGSSQLVQLDGTGKLPAIDGSQLSNLPASGTKLLFEKSLFGGI